MFSFCCNLRQTESSSCENIFSTYNILMSRELLKVQVHKIVETRELWKHTWRM